MASTFFLKVIPKNDSVFDLLLCILFSLNKKVFILMFIWVDEQKG